MSTPILFGGPFSVYVQAIRLVLLEKGVSYKLVHANPFDPMEEDERILENNPFRLIPIFDDGRVLLYESDAIARYVDEAYPGKNLLPTGLEERARANQILSILHSVAYPLWVRTLYIERISNPNRGLPTNEDAVSSALPKSRTAFDEISRFLSESGGPYLLGDEVTLPDLFCCPMLACLIEVSEGKTWIDENPDISGWWTRMISNEVVRSIVIDEIG